MICDICYNERNDMYMCKCGMCYCDRCIIDIIIKYEFKCTNCNHENNADTNSAQNLKFRYTNVLLRSKLHKLDKYNRMIPKIMKKEKIKEILISAYPKVDSG